MKNEIKECYVSFEVARLLKKKGFKVLPENTSSTDYIIGYDCDCEFDENSEVNVREFQWEDCECSHLYLRPSQMVASKWIGMNFNVEIPLYSDESRNNESLLEVLQKLT